MHIDLQYRALPSLIRLVPKIQFIVSSHSPLFVLGMEKTFGVEGIAIIDMPSGTPIQAEGYAEFGHALQVLQDTKAFSAAIEAAAGAPGKPLVLLEGETDPIYLQTAADLLERRALLDKVEFEWVGAKDPKGGQSFNTGKDALNHTFNVLRAKPHLAKRPVILLYDNDANKPQEDHGSLYVRSMPSNSTNDVVDAGIENLLPSNSITEPMFDVKTKKSPNGSTTTIKAIDKMRLCNHICQQKRDPADFAEFAFVLDMVAAIVATAVVEPAVADAANAAPTAAAEEAP